MFDLLSPTKLSEFLDDYENTFWDGDGKILIRNDELIATLLKNPKITIGGLQAELKKDLVSAGC